MLSIGCCRLQVFLLWLLCRLCTKYVQSKRIMTDYVKYCFHVSSRVLMSCIRIVTSIPIIDKVSGTSVRIGHTLFFAIHILRSVHKLGVVLLHGYGSRLLFVLDYVTVRNFVNLIEVFLLQYLPIVVS